MDFSSSGCHEAGVGNDDSFTAEYSLVSDVFSSGYTDNMGSDDLLSHYHDLLNQHAQAAAVRMIGLPSLELLPNICSEQHDSVKSPDKRARLTLPDEVLADDARITSSNEVTADDTRLTTSEEVSAYETPVRSIHTRQNKRSKKRPVSQGEKNYTCDQCDYTSKWSHALSNHMRVHNGTEFKCSFCAYTTKWKGDLTDHVRVHTGKLFDCTECGFKSSKRQTLVKHMRIHSGAKPYKCKMCEYSCTQSGNLKKHMRRHSLGNQQHKSNNDRMEHPSNEGSNDSLEKELSSDYTVASYTCALCRNTLQSPGDYLNHILSQHMVSSDSRCYYVCLQSLNESSIQEHCDTYHCNKKLTKDVGVNTDPG